jgi:hypothetical protein
MADKDPSSKNSMQSASSCLMKQRRRLLRGHSRLFLTLTPSAFPTASRRAQWEEGVGEYRLTIHVGFAAFGPTRRTMPASTGSPRPRSAPSMRRNLPNGD